MLWLQPFSPFFEMLMVNPRYQKAKKMMNKSSIKYRPIRDLCNIKQDHNHDMQVN